MLGQIPQNRTSGITAVGFYTSCALPVAKPMGCQSSISFYHLSLDLIDDIALLLQQNRLRWYGHVLRKKDDDWVTNCMEYKVEGPRPRGRPKRTWSSAFLWRYEPVRRTGKSDDWLTIFFARIIRFTVQKFQLFWVIFCIIIFFIELWHILILWLAKMPNGGMPVFTLIATGWRYRKIFFYKKSTDLERGCTRELSST